MAKRKYVEKYGALYKTFPIFEWRKCCNCNKEFRREWGWRALTGPFIGTRGRWRYLCSDCAPTECEASTYFLEHRYVPPKPPAPPAPQPIVNQK